MDDGRFTPVRPSSWIPPLDPDVTPRLSRRSPGPRPRSVSKVGPPDRTRLHRTEIRREYEWVPTLLSPSTTGTTFTVSLRFPCVDDRQSVNVGTGYERLFFSTRHVDVLLVHLLRLRNLSLSGLNGRCPSVHSVNQKNSIKWMETDCLPNLLHNIHSTDSTMSTSFYPSMEGRPFRRYHQPSYLRPLSTESKFRTKTMNNRHTRTCSMDWGDPESKEDVFDLYYYQELESSL